MSLKKLFFASLYAIAVFALWLYSADKYTENAIVTGTKDMHFDFVVIKPIIVTAGSCDGEFSWQNRKTGEVFVSNTPVNAGLGTDCKNYYQNTKLLNHGYWDNISGYAEFKISSGNSIVEVMPEFEITSIYIVFFVIFSIFGTLAYFTLAATSQKS